MQKVSMYHSDQLKGHIFAYSTGEGKKDKAEHETIKNFFKIWYFSCYTLLIIWVQKLFGIQISHLLDPGLKSQLS